MIIKSTLPVQLAPVTIIIPIKIIVVVTKELFVVPNLATSKPETIGIIVLHRVSEAINNENCVFVKSSCYLFK